MLIQGESGLLSVYGTPEGAARVGISVCDIAVGETACAAVRQALIARDRTGKGCAIEVSLVHTMADWMNVPYLQTRYGGTAPPRLGLRHPSIAPYGTFTCADGRQVRLSLRNDRERAALCGRVLGKPALAQDERYATNVARMAEVEASIAPVLARIDHEAAVALLSGAGIACGRLSTMGDLEYHPQSRHVTASSPTGPVEMMARGVRHGGDVPEGATVPALGQHSTALRAEFHAPGRRRA